MASDETLYKLYMKKWCLKSETAATNSTSLKKQTRFRIKSSFKFGLEAVLYYVRKRKYNQELSIREE